MPDETIKLGHIVISSRGRDTGHAYVVMGWYKPNTLLIADGRGRKAQSPKRKNLKHVVLLNSIANTVAEKLTEGSIPTNEELRKALAKIEMSSNATECGLGGKSSCPNKT